MHCGIDKGTGARGRRPWWRRALVLMAEHDRKKGGGRAIAWVKQKLTLSRSVAVAWLEKEGR